MRGAIPPLPTISSWRCTYLKTGTTLLSTLHVYAPFFWRLSHNEHSEDRQCLIVTDSELQK
jgi:hypothetical protein